MSDLNQENWTKQLKSDNNAVVLDVRTDMEIAEGFIPNAIHVDLHKGQGFIDELQTLDKNKNYYVYCKSGGRSAQACAVMNQLGFNNTFNLLGGFSEWSGEVALISD